MPSSETMSVYGQIRDGVFDEDLQFLTTAIRDRWHKLNPLEKIKEQAGLKAPSDFAPGSYWRVRYGRVKPKYLNGALVKIVGDSRMGGRVKGEIIAIPHAGNRTNMRFKVGNRVDFLVSQLEKGEGV